MKKVLIIFWIIFELFTQQNFSQNAPISTVGTIVSSESTVIVPITAINFTNIRSCNLTLLYNPAIISIDSVKIGPLLGGSISTNLTVPGTIILGWFTYPGVTLSDNPVIFNIYCKKVTIGTSNITWYTDNYSCLWYDGNGAYLNDIPYTTYYLNGSLTFGPAGTPGLWTGVTSTAWSTSTNWDDGLVPVSSTNVLIPSSAPLWPAYTGDLIIGATCNSITMNGASFATISGNFVINSGKSLTITNNGTLKIAGNWTNAGSFSAGTGTIEFTGSTSASIISGPVTNTFYNLTISKSAGITLTIVPDIIVNGNVTINP